MSINPETSVGDLAGEQISRIEVFEKFGHLTDILPAMGYGSDQIADLEATINATPCDVVLIGTPIDLAGLIKINKPAYRVTYDLDGAGSAALERVLRGHKRLA